MEASRGPILFRCDGTPDGAEARLHTDPLATGSFFQARMTRDGLGRPVASWVSAAGTFFTVQRSTDLIAWEEIATGVAGGMGETQYVDEAAPAGAARLFYRVALEAE